MAQSDVTRKKVDGSRLPSIAPAKVQQILAENEQLAVASEFFESLDTNQIDSPEVQDVLIEPSDARLKSSPVANVESEAVVAEIDSAGEELWDNALDEALGSALQRALPVPQAPKPRKKAKVNRAIPMARRAEVGIHIREMDDEPFQWRDALTRKWWKQNSSFLISLVLHTLLLLFLSLLVVRSGIGDSALFLDVAEAPATPDEDMLDPVQINPVLFENDNVIAESPLNELLDDVAEKEDADSLKIEDLGKDSELFSGEFSNENKVRGDGKSASFFGTKASGRQFVFVVDRSPSMEYGSENYVSREMFNRYDVAKSELVSAIESLQPHQEFFVIMFADDSIAMFREDTIESTGDSEFEMVAATDENKVKFHRWLDYVPMGSGTDPRIALDIAIEMEPDAIFMLSDGAFVSERRDNRPKTRDIVRGHVLNGTIVPINTVSLVVEETIPTMEAIARQSGGMFRFTTIKDYIKQIASLRGPMRARALEQLIDASDGGWSERHELITKNLLPMLVDRSARTRATAESLLHRATMGLFEDHVDPMFHTNSQATNQWNEIIREIDGFHRTEQVTALGRGRELEEKLLLAMLELEDDSFLQMFEKLNMETVSSLTMVEMVRGIERSHRELGTSPESTIWLKDLIARLSGKKPKDRSEQRKVAWKAEQAQAAIDRLFESRQKRAESIYRKYRDPDRGLNVRERLARSLVDKFPETKEAGRVRSEMLRKKVEDIPVGIFVDDDKDQDQKEENRPTVKDVF